MDGIALSRGTARQQSSPVALNAGAGPSWRLALLDLNVLDATGHTAIDWFVASPDGGTPQTT